MPFNRILHTTNRNRYIDASIQAFTTSKQRENSRTLYNFISYFVFLFIK